MKVLVFGAKGWIGQQFTDILTQKEIEWVGAVSRADDEQAAELEIAESGATHVVSLIGRTHGKGFSTIDYLEQPGKLVENVRDNLFAPVSLALICNQHGLHFTYLGTGCIFEYDEETGHPYGLEVNGFTEESRPNFFGSSYSVVKGFTDRLMHNLNALNLRIRMPITETNHPRNFITKITNYAKICSVPNSMTVLPELLPMAVDMMCRGRVGTLNLTNPGLITHNEILALYKEIVDPDFVWENFSVEEQAQILAAGRSNNYLDTRLLESWHPEVRNIKEAVRHILQSWISK